MIRLNISQSELASTANDRPLLATCQESDLQVLVWARPDGGYIATPLECPHEKADLKGGRVVEKEGRIAVMCWKHAWYFACENGSVFFPPRALSRWPEDKREAMKLWRVVAKDDGVFLLP